MGTRKKDVLMFEHFLTSDFFLCNSNNYIYNFEPCFSHLNYIISISYIINHAYKNILIVAIILSSG